MGPQEMGPRMTLTSCRKQFISIQLKVPADLQLDKIVFRANGIEKKKKDTVHRTCICGQRKVYIHV